MKGRNKLIKQLVFYLLMNEALASLALFMCIISQTKLSKNMNDWSLLFILLIPIGQWIRERLDLSSFVEEHLKFKRIWRIIWIIILILLVGFILLH